MATNPSQGNLPLVRIENTGAAQTNVPFTFGQVFKVGALKPGAGLAAQIEGGTIPLQVDYKATHGDGSVRHAIVSGILPSLSAGATVALQLVESQALGMPTLSPPVMPNGVVEITIDGVKYSTNGSRFDGIIEWLSGPVVAEGFIAADLLDPSGNPHSHLNVRAGIRAYASGHVRVEVIVENNKALTAGAAKFVYDVTIKLAGETVFEQKDLNHYAHARWRKVFWADKAPQIEVKPGVEYLIASKAVSNYDQTIKPSEGLLSGFAKALNANNTAPMGIGPVVSYMGTTGGRGDIGPLPVWSVAYLLSLDKRARDSMIAVAEGSGSWSIHYRDEATGLPLRVDTEANKNITTHGNLLGVGPLPAPRFAPTPYSPDVAHQPSMAYLPYLLTGDYYYLEEIQFWAAWNPLGTDPGNSGRGQGLLRWHQLRGQAWAMRTLGHAAYITPDAHPLKDYFIKQLENNLDFYHETYVVGNPNALGAYDGSGSSAFQINGSAPWQDDFFTWSFGYLGELGFEKAVPIFKWKAKYPVGRMTAPGFCWIKAASYSLAIRPVGSKKVFDNFADVYLANFSGDTVPYEGGMKTHPKGLKFIDMPCASQEMADWVNATSSFGWGPRRMDGYADSTEGYPANMQPALALTAQYEVEDAGFAWERFLTRDAKPKYQNGPQWNIIPRNYTPAVIAPVPVPTPTPSPNPSTGEVWVKIGVEGEKLTVPAGSRVRYGIVDSYLEKDVSGEFTATNVFFGRDPAVGKVKTVQLKTVGVVAEPTPMPVPTTGYAIKERTVYILIGPDGVEMARFDDNKFAQQVLSKF